MRNLIKLISSNDILFIVDYYASIKFLGELYEWIYVGISVGGLFRGWMVLYQWTDNLCTSVMSIGGKWNRWFSFGNICWRN